MPDIHSEVETPLIPEGDSLSSAVSLLKLVKNDLLDEYLSAEHRFPWIVGYSGGKDSTLLLHLVFEMLLELAPGDRIRPVHVLTNDTLVESPLVSAYVHRMMKRLHDASESLNLPIVVATTRPDPNDTFWVNLIGRGYPAPNRNFRWCTDRMKIQPTSNYIKSQVAANGEVILLLGVRSDESATRARSVARYTSADGARLNSHNDLKGCMVYRPIKDFTTDEVWSLLLQRPPPWGSSHRELITLYRNAKGGECPLVMEKSQAPSCGSSSSRFGCWTCTVVEKDRSMQGFIDAGFEHLYPLLEFRDWLASIRSDPSRRMAERRNGQITFMEDGKMVPGPFTLAARQEILDRLLKLQDEIREALNEEPQEDMDMVLIGDDEVALIKSIWAEDTLVNVARALRTHGRAAIEV